MNDTSTKPPGYYDHARPDVAAHVPKGTKRLLDVGCGNGAFGRLCKDQGLAEYVAGIDDDEARWLAEHLGLASGQKKCFGLNDFYSADLDTMRVFDYSHIAVPVEEESTIAYEIGSFDCVTFNDVLEHLKNPLGVLRDISEYLLDENGTVLISLPNARFFPVLYMHLKGHWHYEDAGVMDRTHLRFFCLPEMFQLVLDAGLEPLYAQPLAMMSSQEFACLTKEFPDALQLSRLAAGSDLRSFQDLMTVQYLIAAKKPERKPAA